MASLTRIFSLRKIERFLFRPLFVFFTFGLVLLAIFQASGRFTMASLALFEDEVNAVLGTQRIQVQGLSGAWRGLNPVVMARRVEFPAGTITDLQVELDVLESMVRSAPIAKLLAADQVDLHVERVDEGWRLRGMSGDAPQLELADSIRHSDEVRGRIHLHLHTGAEREEQLLADVLVANRGGVHHAGLHLRNPVDDGQLNVSVWQREAVWPIQEQAQAVTIDGELRVPRALLDMPELTLRIVDGYYADNRGMGTGQVQLTVQGLHLPASDNVLDAAVDLALARDEDHWRGRIDELHTQVAGDEYAIGPIYLQGDVPGEKSSHLEAAVELIGAEVSQPLLSLWLEELNLAELGSYFVRHLGAWEPASRWVRELAVQGVARNIHGFYDPELGLGYMASLADVQMQGYKGAPTVVNVQGQVWGHQQAVVMQVRARDSYLGFPDLYRQGWTLNTVQGVVKAWFGDGYFGMRGTHLRASLGETDIGGAFAVTRPGEKYEQRLSLQIDGNQADMTLAKSLVPDRVPDGLRQWLETGPRSGRLRNARFAMHGQVHLRTNELGRRLELLSDIADGQVEYAPGWPLVADVQGRVHVAGVDTRVEVERAVSQRVQIRDAKIVLRNNSAYVSGELQATADAGAALEFVRTSPLQENLSFVTPAWQGSGRLQMQGALTIPIKAEAAPPLAVELQFDSDNIALAMPEYRMVVRQLDGSGTFSLPHHLQGEFSASLFGQPAGIHAHYNDDWLFFDIDGRATPDDVYRILETEGRVPIEGAFNFDSILAIAMSGGVTNLFVESDLQGLRIDLPGDFAKDAETVETGDVNLQFLGDYQSVSWRYRDVRGWLHYGEGIERGALGVGVPPPMTAQTERAIVIAGRVPQLVLSDWVSNQGDSAVALPLDWMIQGLNVDQFAIDQVNFENVLLTGEQRGDATRFTFAGPTVRGRVELQGTAPITIALDYLQLPTTDEVIETHIGAPQLDPISVAVGRSLPAAQVTIDELKIGDEPFGSWRFNLVPDTDSVLFSEFSADVNGVHIEDSTLTWDLQQDVSSFSGRLRLDDLAETLPKWDYAPSLSTDKARVLAEVNWPGSPLNVNLVGTTGQVDFEASDGRFIEVDSSASGLRILGLLNFTKVAKRMSFDFSDVVGDGLSFEKIDAKVDLQAGELIFPRRMTVESSSGDFQVGGRVDLRSGELDNEMIVTLPVSKSLPWYGVYLALVNPIAGLGVVVGERVLRKPIEQFSTAKFEVTGTLEEPEVKFISLWDQSMKEVPSPAAQPGVKSTKSEEETAKPQEDGSAQDIKAENVLGAVTAGGPGAVESEP